MPHTLSWQDKGLLRTFTGTITGAEIFDSNLAMHGDQRFDEIGYVINDFSQIENCIVSEEELEELKTVDNVAALTNPYLRIAIIVTNSAFIDLARIYCESMRDAAYDAELFASFDEALKWAKARPSQGF